METGIKFQDCIQICHQLNENIKKSFGPRGQIVFLLTCTGQVEFTTSGLKIINSLHLCNPVAQIIQRSLKKYHDIVGDGSKIFLLLLNEMFINILDMKQTFEDSFRIKLINGFNLLLQIILPKCFWLLKFKIHLFVPKDNDKITFYLLKTFFCGKFGAVVSDHLSDLFYQFIINFCKNINPPSLKCLIDHFDSVCTITASFSISDSQIKPGIILSQGLLVNCENEFVDESVLKFIVYINDSNNLKESSLCVSNKETIKKLFYVTHTNALEILETMKQYEISVIICSGAFPNSLKDLCRQNKINVIAMVPIEEINYLLFLSQIEPVYNLLDTFSEKNYKNLSFIKSIQMGSKTCTYLGLQSYQSIQPHHLLLCGPTESICKQYSKECLNSLKLIYYWRNSNDQFSEYEEEKCDTTTNSKLNNSNVDFSKYIDELVHKLKINDGENLFKKNSENILATVIPGGCCWEIYLHYILENINLSNYPLEVSMVCKILSKSLLVVPQTFFENNHNTNVRFIQMLTSIYKQLNSDNICYFNKWGEIQSIKDADVFEPIIGKELLIFSVIQVIIQLLRVDCVTNI